MASNARDWSRQMDQRIDQLERGMNRRVQDVSLAFLWTVVTATPVDTGLARTAWIASLNKPNRKIPKKPHLPIEKRTDPSKFKERQNALASMRAGTAIVRRRNRLGQPIYIQNLIDYLKSLNRGSSGQAPPAFIQRAFQSAKIASRDADGTIFLSAAPS